MKFKRFIGYLGVLPVALLLSGTANIDTKSLSGGSATVFDDSRDAYSQASPVMDTDNMAAFIQGRGLFRQSWVVAPANDRAAGLGPLYNRISCIACHAKNGRGGAPDGPDGTMQAMLLRLSIPGSNPHGGPKPHPAYGDQLNERGVPGVPGEGIGFLIYDENVETLADGTKVTLRKPNVHFKEMAYGALGTDVMVSPRVGPVIYGLGLLEAVSDETILAMAKQAKPDGIAGRVNMVWDAMAQKEAIGRFGMKANVATLTEQIANAFSGDLGITSPLIPQENCTKVQTACQRAPSGGEPELTRAELYATVFYTRMLAVPARRDVNNKQVIHGNRLFVQARCIACHASPLRTRPDAALPALSNQLIRPYTDLLLHDMGPGLADGRSDYLATGKEWRTPPLWGIGLTHKVNPDAGYLHDGRARTLLEAIMWHGGEGNYSKEAVRAMSTEDRTALLRFLESL
ncbi:di-heme oxidoreductase family protein [Herminiimonas arsenitoxidans]|uniref:di-heme oxidoreductase family protein n=1 Tax=Herminiimonas arsenitoxidans TaxID=1809410 RepID=UPI0009713BC4|nr:di-heme oxidoredictase family protein [Herminiimonas arsenitoxidans]